MTLVPNAVAPTAAIPPVAIATFCSVDKPCCSTPPLKFTPFASVSLSWSILLARSSIVAGKSSCESSSPFPTASIRALRRSLISSARAVPAIPRPTAPAIKPTILPTLPPPLKPFV